MNINTVVIGGGVTRTTELRYTPNGKSMCSIGMALNKKWKDEKTGEWREDVTFVDVDIWGAQAETVHKHVGKGDQVLVEGCLKLDQWEDKATGQKRSKLKVVAQRVHFVTKRAAPQPQAPAPAAQSQAPAPTTPDDDLGKDAPF